jgi:predicted HAD superfamily hydrolase
MNIINFKQLRQKAEQLSNGTFDDIYLKLQNISGFSYELIQQLKQTELDVELENIFPIIENKIQVRPQDIFISDMYLPKEAINKLLIKSGFSGLNKIYVSPYGKKTGIIWNQISENITYHIGDNYNSDILNAFMWGNKRGIHYTDSINLTNTEKMLLKWGLFELAQLIKYVRLSNDYLEEPYKSLYTEQVNKNISILILYSFYINQICIEKNINKILFTTRDCCLLSKIFNKLFPQYEQITFNSSRIIYENPSEDYINYVKSIYTDNSIIVDLQGSGKSIFNFFEKYINIKPNVVYLILFTLEYDFTHVIYNRKGDNLENINFNDDSKLLILIIK